MKILKYTLTIISFLIISQLTFANAACLGQPTTLNYSSSGIPSGQSCSIPVVPINFAAPATPTANTSGAWTITVPNNAAGGNQAFSLTCGTGVSQTTGGASLGVDATKVWNGSACETEQRPTGTFTSSDAGITLGQSITVSSTANDGNANMTNHVFDWRSPSCNPSRPDCWSWATSGAGGTLSGGFEVDWANQRGGFAKAGTHAYSDGSPLNYTFTPSQAGGLSMFDNLQTLTHKFTKSYSNSMPLKSMR